jgi:hypothetical protein
VPTGLSRGKLYNGHRRAFVFDLEETGVPLLLSFSRASRRRTRGKPKENVGPFLFSPFFSFFFFFLFSFVFFSDRFEYEELKKM